MEKLLSFDYNGVYRDLYCNDNYFKVTTDNLCLTNFIKLRPSDKLLVDFGSGLFIIPILLSCKYDVKIIGIELDNEACLLAHKSIVKNKLEKHITVINDKIQNVRNYFDINSVSVVVCNPPYFGTGKISPNSIKALARHELGMSFDDVLKYANLILKDKGRFYFVYRVERLGDIQELLRKYNFSLKRIQIIYPSAYKRAKLVLVEACKNGRIDGLIVERPIILEGGAENV